MIIYHKFTYCRGEGRKCCVMKVVYTRIKNNPLLIDLTITVVRLIIYRLRDNEK